MTHFMKFEPKRV